MRTESVEHNMHYIGVKPYSLLATEKPHIRNESGGIVHPLFIGYGGHKLTVFTTSTSVTNTEDIYGIDHTHVGMQ